MKTTSKEYAFTKSELTIFEQLAKGRYELSSIKKECSIKSSLLSYNLKKLLDKGLIKATGQGYKKQVMSMIQNTLPSIETSYCLMITSTGKTS